MVENNALLLASFGNSACLNRSLLPSKKVEQLGPGPLSHLLFLRGVGQTH